MRNILKVRLRIMDIQVRIVSVLYSNQEKICAIVRVFLHPNDKNQIPYVSGEALKNEKFILDSFHFHWGIDEFNGSEHSINNMKRSAEVSV